MWGSATDPELVARLGFAPPSYEGPTGITGILLWAAVLHYIATTPNPKAALALIRKLEGLVGVAISAPGLEAAAADCGRPVDRAVESDPDVQAMVEQLEQAADSAAPQDKGPVPTGDASALDLQRFLRQREGAGGA